MASDDVPRRVSGSNDVIGSGRSAQYAGFFLMQVLLARSLGVHEFGVFQQVFILAVIGAVGAMGIPETVMFFLPRLTGEDRPRFVGQTVLVLAFLGIASFSLCWVLAPWLGGVYEDAGLVPLMRLCGVYVGCMVAAAFAEPVFVLVRELRFLTAMNLIQGSIYLGIGVWRITADISLEKVFTALALAGVGRLLLAIWLLWRVRRETDGIRFRIGRETLALQAGFAAPMALVTIADAVPRWLDKIIAALFLGTTPLGIVGIASVDLPFLSIFSAVVSASLFPLLHDLGGQSDLDRIRRLWRNAVRFIASVVWPGTLFLAAFAAPILQAVLGADYSAAAMPFRIYLVSATFLAFPAGAAVIALGNARFQLLAVAGGAFTTLAVMVFFLERLGVIALPVAVVAGLAVQTGMLVWFLSRRLECTMGALLPLGDLADMVLAGMIAVTASFAITHGAEGGLGSLLLSLTLYATIYILSALIIGILGKRRTTRRRDGHPRGRAD